MQTDRRFPPAPIPDDRPARPLFFGPAPHPDEIAAHMARARRLRAEAAADLAARLMALLSRRPATPLGQAGSLR